METTITSNLSGKEMKKMNEKAGTLMILQEQLRIEENMTVAYLKNLKQAEQVLEFLG